MKHIKDITISIFAIIGFAFVLSSFTSNETTETQEVVYGTPESHVWELEVVPADAGSSSKARAFAINKVTGETKLLVRRYNPGTSNVTIGLKSYKAKEIAYGDTGKKYINRD